MQLSVLYYDGKDKFWKFSTQTIAEFVTNEAFSMHSTAKFDCNV